MSKEIIRKYEKLKNIKDKTKDLKEQKIFWVMYQKGQDSKLIKEYFEYV